MQNTNIQGWRERFDEKFPFSIIDWKIGDQNGDDGISVDKMKEIKSFIQEEITKAVQERDAQIISWHKIPIKHTAKNSLGPIVCDVCGGMLFHIRAQHPDGDRRSVCPTCAIEILESIYSNLYPDSGAQSALPEAANTPSK